MFLLGMDGAAAANLMNSVLGLGRQLNHIDAQLRVLPDEAERRSLLLCLGRVMTELSEGLLRALVRQYPDLDPDG
jgi:hypothetical protein